MYSTTLPSCLRETFENDARRYRIATVRDLILYIDNHTNTDDRLNENRKRELDGMCTLRNATCESRKKRTEGPVSTPWRQHEQLAT